MERAPLRTVGAIRSALERGDFRGGWVESVVGGDGGTLTVRVVDRERRRHALSFAGVDSAVGLESRGFVHGAYVRVGRASAGRKAIRVCFVGEESVLEVEARALTIDEPDEPASVPDAASSGD